MAVLNPVSYCTNPKLPGLLGPKVAFVTESLKRDCKRDQGTDTQNTWSTQRWTESDGLGA